MARPSSLYRMLRTRGSISSRAYILPRETINSDCISGKMVEGTSDSTSRKDKTHLVSWSMWTKSTREELYILGGWVVGVSFANLVLFGDTSDAGFHAPQNLSGAQSYVLIDVRFFYPSTIIGQRAQYQDDVFKATQKISSINKIIDPEYQMW